MVRDKLLMIGFEPGSSGFVNDSAANCATITAQFELKSV